MKSELTTLANSENNQPSSDSPRTINGPFSVPAGMVVDLFGNVIKLTGGDICELPDDDRSKLFGFI